MDAKADALKRLKLKSPMAGLGHEKPIQTKGKDDDDKGDLAPDLDAKKPTVPSDLGEEHMGVMQQLSDGVSHPGRGPMTLDERAGDKMKEKMASIKKHKSF